MIELIEPYLPQSITLTELFVRLFVAALFSFLIGIERDYKNKPIDFKAFIVVGVTSCAMAIMTLELENMFSLEPDLITLDIGKPIAGILTGIGFLGAGAILKQDNGRIVGSATGASVWASGGIGLLVGYGFYVIVVPAAFIILLTLAFLGRVIGPKIHDYDDEN